jgi:hypothetical protein
MTPINNGYANWIIVTSGIVAVLRTLTVLFVFIIDIVIVVIVVLTIFIGAHIVIYKKPI